MTRNEVKAAADRFRKDALKAASLSDRNILLRKARNYYQDSGYPGLARRCESWMTK